MKASTSGRSNLTFMAQGRRRRLYRRDHNGVFYVRFFHNGKDRPRSLGTTDENAAKEKARQIIDAEYLGEFEKSRRLKQSNDYAPLNQITEIYEQKFATDARKGRTAATNVNAFRKLVRLGAGVAKLEEGRASVLDGALVRRFEAAEEKRIERDARGFMLQRSELRVRTTICAVLRQARSVFKKSHMHWFEELALPDLTSFREQGVRAPERPKPTRLDAGVIEAINAAAPTLAETSPAIYATFLLFSQAGLRNNEIRAARRNWIVRRPDGSGEIGIIYRPDEEWQPKKNTEGWVPLNREVIEALLRISEADPEGYLVPAPNKTERAKVVDRLHGKWVGQWIKDRTKVSYELRRYAGSLYYQQTGELAKVQKFLRHADLKTTMDWYWYLLEELKPLETPAWLKVLDKPESLGAQSAA